MEDIERIKSRLDNIKSVEPILTALRTIAAGSLRLARSRLEAARLFSDELARVFVGLQPHLPATVLESQEPGTQPPHEEVQTIGLLVIASERGLCGSFNAIVLEAAERYLEEQRRQGHNVILFTLGQRATAHFQRLGIAPMLSESLPVTTVASLASVQRLHRRLVAMQADENHPQDERFALLYVVYTPYRLREAAEPVMHQILPTRLDFSIMEAPSWPPPIIDADPQRMYKRVLQQWSVTELYRCVMESAASEQAARFRVLDGASNNIQRLIEELTLSYHAARQHAITMEILDLVSGAGLLKSTHPSKP